MQHIMDIFGVRYARVPSEIFDIITADVGRLKFPFVVV